MLVAIGVWQHVRRGRAGRGVLVAATAVYALVLLAATALPLPANPEVGCGSPTSRWLLAPGTSLVDAFSEASQTGLRSATTHYQFGLVLGNIALFVPLGFLVAYAWRRGPVSALLLGLGASAVLETLQFTALLGLYPCAYRQADVDDMLMNTAGAMVGWLLGWLIVRRAPGRGVEPLFTDSKSAVLPLDDPGPTGAAGGRTNTRHRDEADERSANPGEVD